MIKIIPKSAQSDDFMFPTVAFDAEENNEIAGNAIAVFDIEKSIAEIKILNDNNNTIIRDLLIRAVYNYALNRNIQQAFDFDNNNNLVNLEEFFARKCESAKK